MDGLSPERGQPRGVLHHVELWVPDLDRAVASVGWLLEAMGYTSHQEWAEGRSWMLGATYVVVEQSQAATAGVHERTRPGLNHLAFHAGEPEDVDRLVTEAETRGWVLLFADRHPHAGGAEHYAAYLENPDGFEVELVAHRPG